MPSDIIPGFNSIREETIHAIARIGGMQASGIHIPNLPANYPMNLHEIKTMCTNITPEHIDQIFLYNYNWVGSYQQSTKNKYISHFSKWMRNWTVIRHVFRKGIHSRNLFNNYLFIFLYTYGVVILANYLLIFLYTYGVVILANYLEYC